MSDNQIAVKISADASEFRRGAEEAGQRVDTLAEKLKAFRNHARTESRYTKFIAGQIEGIGIASDGAAGAVGHLVAAMAFGSGFGIAAAGAKVLAEGISHLGEEAHKQSEIFKKMTEDTDAYVSAVRKHVEDILASLRGATQADEMMRKGALPELREKIRLTDQLRVAEKKVADIESNTDENGGVADVVGLIKAQEAVENLKRQISELQPKLSANIQGSGDVGSGVAAAERRKKAESDLNDILQERHFIQNAENIVSTELWSRAVEQMHVDAETLRLKKEQERADAQAVLDAERLVSPLVSVAEFERIAAEEAEDLAREMRVQKEEAKKLAHELGRAALRMGEAGGQAFLGMLQGVKSVEDALVQLIGQMVEAALRMAALREIASGDFIGGALLGAASVIAGGIGSLTGGGGSTNLTVNNTFHGTQNASEVSLAMERSAMSVIRRMQARGRFT